MVIGNGLGAGNSSEKGAQYATESYEVIKSRITNKYKVVIIITALGGGTGTGASPIVAKIAREQEILTLCIASMPFSAEGKQRNEQAIRGLEKLKQCADSVCVFSNDYLINIYGSLSLNKAFEKSDEFFKLPVDFILDVFENPFKMINVDYADLEVVLRNSGLSAFSHSVGTGKNRIKEAIDNLSISPYISNVNADSVENILLQIEYGRNGLSMNDVQVLLESIRNKYRQHNASIVWGIKENLNLTNEIIIECIFGGISDREIPSLSNPNDYEIGRQTPLHLSQSVEKIKADYPNKKIAFLIMKFGTGKKYDQIVASIKKTLAEEGIMTLRADDKQYNDDLLSNILAYIYASDFGIAVFERVSDDDINPNVAFEIGYMMGVNKEVCLLKEKSLKRLNTDIIGRIYKEFDIDDIETSIKCNLMKWITDKELLS